MARANRYYIPGLIWHITHRCHKKEFLLIFAKDRRRWMQWLFESKKRFGTRILNYMVTSNHIHLLVQDDAGRDVLPKSIQLTAGRTAQEYNLRKSRKDAFWANKNNFLRLPGKMRHVVHAGRPAENAAAQQGNIIKPGDVL